MQGNFQFLTTRGPVTPPSGSRINRIS